MPSTAGGSWQQQDQARSQNSAPTSGGDWQGREKWSQQDQSRSSGGASASGGWQQQEPGRGQWPQQEQARTSSAGPASGGDWQPRGQWEQQEQPGAAAAASGGNWQQEEQTGGQWAQQGQGRAYSAPPSAPSRSDKGNEKGKGKGKSGKGAEFAISKALSRILRHQATGMGVEIRPDGYCEVQEVLALQDLQNLDCTVEALRAVVNNNDKARFELTMENGREWIRATQGHSMKAVVDEEALQPLSATDRNLPEDCVHGTYRRYMDSINTKGLVPGGGFSNRNHVHFAPFAPRDGRVISGMRSNCEVAIYIDLPRALNDGVPFFQSANGVILSPGWNGSIPPCYFKDVVHL